MPIFFCFWGMFVSLWCETTFGASQSKIGDSQIKKRKSMETVTLEYDVQNEIAADLVNVLVKISGVKVLEQKKRGC